MTQTPIVGVCGTVNSGKSTVVASMLSIEQQKRVLIGEFGEEGTHRFVFWLPAAWRGNGIDTAVEELIRSRTNCRPELLAEDPTEAAIQYNARHNRSREFNIPLLAFDAGLDAEGIAFLDCPDIQRSLDDSSQEFTATERLNTLRAMAPMCSAFIVVASMQQLDTETTGKVFTTLTTAAPQAPVYFVLNMTQSDDVRQYRDAAEKALGRWHMAKKVKRIYLSPFLKREASEVRVCPTFLSADDARAPLLELKAELVPADLQKLHFRSSLTNLSLLVTEVGKQVTLSHTQVLETVQKVQEKVCLFVESKFVSREGELRALCFNEVARQMYESIQRTAPRSIRIAQAPVAWFQKLKTTFTKSRPKDEDVEQFAQIKDDDFANSMLGHNCLPQQATREELGAIWQAAYTSVLKDSPSGFRQSGELDRLTRDLWAQVPKAKKFELYRNVAISIAAFTAAGMLVPFDGGASIVIASKFHVILGGAEILAMAIGGPLAGILATLPSAKALVKQLEAEVAKPQVSHLYAALMDGLGAPRYLNEDPILNAPQQIKLNKLDIARTASKIKTVAQPWLEIDEPGFSRLVTQINSL